MKLILVFALLSVAAVSASDLRQYEAEADQQDQDDDVDHTPYEFSYAVADEDTVFSQSERGDESGAVSGQYSVQLPDGRVQTVQYSASDAAGYTADVSYEGEARYPEPQADYQAEQAEQSDDTEEEEEEEEEEEGGDEEELIPIYAYRQVYN